MRAQLAQPNEQFVSDDTYNALFTMHGSTMIYLFVTPMAIALALYLVPLQIGAVSVAAPRLALAGFWIWLSGGLIMQSGWFTATGPGRDGWTAYAPLSNGVNTPGVGQDLWVIAVILAAGGMLVMAPVSSGRSPAAARPACRCCGCPCSRGPPSSASSWWSAPSRS